MFWCHSWLVMAFALSMDLCDVINVDLNLKVRSLKYRNLRETLLYFMSLSGFFFLSLSVSLFVEKQPQQALWSLIPSSSH